MKCLTVELPGRQYEIRIAGGLLDEAGAQIRAVCPRAALAYVVTDSNVAPLYAARVERSLKEAGFRTALHIVPAGEWSKCVDELSALWEDMMACGLTRTDVVVALGGGVVGDLAGFAAATVLRGVDFVQVPTTLLAQVDSSVGGKVAVDLAHGKNLAGAFWQPKLVLMDPETLTTLPDATFADGMAEVIKYGCIWDAAFFDLLEARSTRDAVMAQIETVLYTCCDCKRQVVEADERDTGLRMILNFGHTLGHAYELAGGYETWTHGQAVAAGMCAAAKLGVALGTTPVEIPGRIAALCASFGLPVQIACARDDYAAAIGHDKKGAGGTISLILLDRMGHALARPMTKAALLEQVGTL